MKTTNTIALLRKRYVGLRLLEAFLFSLATGILVYCVSRILSATIVFSILSASVFMLGVFLGYIFYLKLPSISDTRIAFFINKQLLSVNESCDLLLMPINELTPVQELQRLKTEEYLFAAKGSIVFPHRISIASLYLFLVSVFAFIFLLYISSKNNAVTNITVGNRSERPIAEDNEIQVSKFSLYVEPPAYTQVKSFRTSEMNVKVVEGSTVTWSLNFSEPINRASIHISNGDSILAVNRNDYQEASTKIRENVLYQVQWQKEGKQKRISEFYKIEIVNDRLPEVKVDDLPQFTSFKWGERNSIPLKVLLNDDYGLSHAQIIATVSKGSGESVKFREEKLLFDNSNLIKGKSVKASRLLDFNKLGLEPGDELYFYIEAFDNKQPLVQRNRTDTYFIALQDTVSEEVEFDGSLGVDLMPEYFRSQRQIIIDSEKLLADKKNISQQEFNSRSNELGYDQKVLRLKYGQFLGEEFETGISAGIKEQEDEAESESENVAKSFGHDHDKSNEHNLVEDKRSNTKSTAEKEHSHEHEHENENEKSDVATFLHNHDNMEEATFFTVSVKAKLRAALTLMWDSELHLRMYDPKKSLPFQYQTLKLLKEISQDSRVYVHRMGFDPPPIKEDKRLSADLSDIQNTANSTNSSFKSIYPGIEKAVSIISEKLNKQKIELSESDIKVLEAAGKELAVIALKEPGNYMNALAIVRSCIQNDGTTSELNTNLKILQSVFWNILPKADSSPTQKPIALKSLDVKIHDYLNRDR